MESYPQRRESRQTLLLAHVAHTKFTSAGVALPHTHVRTARPPFGSSSIADGAAEHSELAAEHEGPERRRGAILFASLYRCCYPPRRVSLGDRKSRSACPPSKEGADVPRHPRNRHRDCGRHPYRRDRGWRSG